MLAINENKALYHLVINKLKSEKLVGRIAYKNDEPISDADLAKITALDLSKSQFPNISLKGIDKLVNLESFSFKGIGPFELNAMLNNDGNENVENEEDARSYYSEDWFNEKLQEYNNSQIADITPLYGCKKLKKITLPSQNNIESIDLSNFPNLQSINMSACQKLKSIKGLDAVVKSKGAENLNINFKNCQMLASVENIESVAQTIAEMGKESGEKHSIYFPIRAYSHLVSNADFGSEESKERVKQNLASNSAILWCESGLKGDKFALNSAGMVNLMGRIDSVLAGIYSEHFSDVQNMYNVYSWLIENINIDIESYDLLEELEDAEELENLSAQVRTSFNVFYNGKGICVGISNLYALMLSECGFVARTAMCDADYRKLEDHPKLYPNHQVCVVRNALGQDYYFDPTWDTKSSRASRTEDQDKIRYFFNSYDEFRKKHTPVLYQGLTASPDLKKGPEQLVPLQKCEDWISLKNRILSETPEMFDEFIAGFDENDLKERNVGIKERFQNKYAEIKNKFKKIAFNQKRSNMEEPEVVDAEYLADEEPEVVDANMLDFMPNRERER